MYTNFLNEPVPLAEAWTLTENDLVTGIEIGMAKVKANKEGETRENKRIQVCRTFAKDSNLLKMTNMSQIERDIVETYAR